MRTLSFVLFLLTTACGGGGSAAQPDADDGRVCDVSSTAACTDAVGKSNLKWIEDNVFSKQCAFSGCHNGAATAAGRLNLKDPGMSHAAMVGRDSAIAQGTKIVVAGQPKQSYLMMMLQAFPPSELEPMPVAAPPSDIGYMPQAAPPICCQKLDAVERWIAAGAPNN